MPRQQRERETVSLCACLLWLLLEGDKMKPMSSVWKPAANLAADWSNYVAQRDNDKSKGCQTENKAQSFSLSIHSDAERLLPEQSTHTIYIDRRRTAL